MRCSPLFITFSIASLLFQPAGSTYAQTTSPAIGLVKGRVTGPVGEALAGATVIASAIERSAASRSVSTRSDGSYQVSLASGRYELRVLLIGYVATVDSINVTTNGTTVVDFDAQRVRTNLERVAVVGTRGEQRTAISAPVPIDVISAADIQQSGRTETAQMLQSVAPSINFPRATIADGTDHIRPVTLRGLSPDQALILVNGKRRHTSALVNLNGFIGRGSQAVDLNAIPASMIDHIEILRDGAAAQYGSDAIAGVVNIILKSQAVGNFSIETGQNITTYNRDATPAVAFPGQLAEQSVHDGQVVTSSLNYGWTPGERSYLQIGGEIRDRAGTNRSLPDTRQQYFTGDPRNLRAPIINHWQGDSYNHDTQLFLNSSHTFDNDVELYAFGGYGHRRGASAGFWRRPLDDRTVRSLYPDGFLPFIKSDIDDGSFSVGAKGNALGWKWDLGSVYGRNAFGFTIDNSANVSLGNASPTSFNAGKLTSAQSTTTLDLFRQVKTPWNTPLRLAFGAEFRADGYSIAQGDSASWRDGGVRVLDTNGVATTRFAALGSQVFPGFRPGDAGAHSRTNGAAYVDIENEITSKLLVDVAGRAEHYSDFGSTTTGKIAARYKLAERFVLRGAASSGFRAPSLGQEFFSSTATNFIAGVPFDVRTFPVNTAEARLLGARDLKPERSLNLSAGIAVEPVTGLALTADYYRITIDKRIVLSDNFTGTAIQALFEQAGLHGVSGGRFFSNAIDTRSNGVDLVASYNAQIGRSAVLRLTSGYNHNTVKVTRVDSTPPQLRAFQESLFGHIERVRIERGNPRDNFFVSANYTRGNFGLNARTQRYGEVSIAAGATSANATGTLDQTFGAKWISDLAASYALRSRYTLTIGADNIFDVYPDRNLNPGNPATTNGGLSNFGIFPYNGVSPFGFNGRFVYTKLSVGL